MPSGKAMFSISTYAAFNKGEALIVFGNLPFSFETAAPAISRKAYMPNLCALSVENIPDGLLAGNSFIFLKVRGS